MHQRPPDPFLWTLSRLCFRAGSYLLLFVGGIWADISHQRHAARGDVALRLLAQAWNGRRAMRLVGVGVSGFGERYEQLRLWEDDDVIHQRDA
jgi:hypothetical protein